jgi:hypothetical protein
VGPPCMRVKKGLLDLTAPLYRDRRPVTRQNGAGRGGGKAPHCCLWLGASLAGSNLHTLSPLKACPTARVDMVGKVALIDHTLLLTPVKEYLE